MPVDFSTEMHSEIILSHKIQEKLAGIWYQLGHPSASRRQKSDATRASPAPGTSDTRLSHGSFRALLLKGWSVGWQHQHSHEAC